MMESDGGRAVRSQRWSGRPQWLKVSVEVSGEEPTGQPWTAGTLCKLYSVSDQPFNVN